jgi:hypothetical protein
MQNAKIKNKKLKMQKVFLLKV